ncbi:cation transporter [Flavobacterium agricola]|uniref:Cation transporter n=1 Tax=Flavobacterium agricola TaxID=2870839 RepID=A0ABY6LZG4_9FLAO|nr:heavy metal-associated domain-containing protein [Flavobacterium agricola]UYW00840.1 cation transporter [Flavobacterium agricola]
MKKYIFIVLAAIGFTACNNKTENTVAETNAEVATTNLAKAKAEIAPENLAETEFKIEGMTCQMGCANTIKSKLEAVTGVDKADVSFDQENAIVYYDKSVVTVDDLKNTVNNIADGKLYKVAE